MVKTRHRKQQLTQLPAGTRAMTGKAQSNTKAKTYQRPLPVQVLHVPAQQAGPIKRGAPATGSTPYTLPAWIDYIFTICGFPDPTKRLAKQKERECEIVIGRWDPLSKSVYLDVTMPSTSTSALSNEKEDIQTNAEQGQSLAMRYLWESGFFGKGTLSRSEPTWHQRQVNSIRVKRERERGGKVYTPEELTALRRKERKAAKIERARLAVRAGQQLADGIVALGGELTADDEKRIERAAESELKEEDKDESAYGKHIPGLIYLKPQEREQVEQKGRDVEITAADVDDEYIDVADMERLQLSSYETLFLAGMIGVLQVTDEEGAYISLEHLYTLLLASAIPPQHFTQSLLSTTPHHHLLTKQEQWSRPDNPFLLNYVVYHHFRSLGWVVKSGIKFCVDFLLYKRGPAFSHAEFAVLVIPVYEEPKDESCSPFGKHPNGNERDWVWFSSVNRVNTQVLKTLILCHVTIPPFSSLPSNYLSRPEALVEGLSAGRLYHIREYSIRRFTPQRMRA